MIIHADVYLELTVNLQGVYRPAYKARIPRGEYQPMEPDEPAGVEDIDIVGMSGSRWQSSAGKITELHLDLFKGVNVADPNFQKVLDNLMEVVGDRAEDAFEAPEYEAEDF